MPAKTSHLHAAVAAVLSSALLLATASQANAAFNQPNDIWRLQGAQYLVMFVTADGITSTSTAIADYNNFVSNEAALGGSDSLTYSIINGSSTDSTLTSLSQWYAAVSTTANNAIDNLAHSTTATIPIYDTQGNRIANSLADLWAGNVMSPIIYNQSGDLSGDNQVWTGTMGSGLKTSSTSNPVGSPLGNWTGSLPRLNSPTYGDIYASVNTVTGYLNQEWINAGQITNYNKPASSKYYPLYALSQPITVIPEPATLTLLGSLVVGMGGILIIRRRGSND